MGGEDSCKEFVIVVQSAKISVLGPESKMKLQEPRLLAGEGEGNPLDGNLVRGFFHPVRTPFKTQGEFHLVAWG